MHPLTFQTEKARNLQRTQTYTEGLLWEALRNGKVCWMKFRRQHSVPQSRFIADFCCPALKLVIEIDGAYHNKPEQVERDHERQMLVSELGYTFSRFTNEQVMNNLPDVLQSIQDIVQLLMKTRIYQGSAKP